MLPKAHASTWRGQVDGLLEGKGVQECICSQLVCDRLGRSSPDTCARFFPLHHAVVSRFLVYFFEHQRNCTNLSSPSIHHCPKEDQDQPWCQKNPKTSRDLPLGHLLESLSVPTLSRKKSNADFLCLEGNIKTCLQVKPTLPLGLGRQVPKVPQNFFSSKDNSIQGVLLVLRLRNFYSRWRNKDGKHKEEGGD